MAAQLHDAREALKASRTERDELRAALAASEQERVAEADTHAQKATNWEREKQRQQQRITELETALDVACQREAVLKEAADALGLVRSSARLCCAPIGLYCCNMFVMRCNMVHVPGGRRRALLWCELPRRPVTRPPALDGRFCCRSSSECACDTASRFGSCPRAQQYFPACVEGGGMAYPPVVS